VAAFCPGELSHVYPFSIFSFYDAVSRGSDLRSPALEPAEQVEEQAPVEATPEAVE
jgi:hypothetical protein